MRKVKITADAVLAIVRGIFEDEDVDFMVDDLSAPDGWFGKRVGEILNVEYYTFKHRPVSTQDVINKALEIEGSTDQLMALGRSFCALSLSEVERLYSKDVDMVALGATMEYFIQSDKVKLLEYLIEESNIAISGLRIPVSFGEETRKAVVFFGRPDLVDVVTGTPFGEMALVEVEVVLMLYPDVVSYSEYTVSVTYEDGDKGHVTSTVPLTSFSVANVMTQDAVPYIGNKQKVGNINLSCGNSFVLVFEGYNNPFINFITDKALSAADEDNNRPFTLTIERDKKTYTHEVVIKDHQTTVNADTGNETHTLTFVTRGMTNGTP